MKYKKAPIIFLISLLAVPNIFGKNAAELENILSNKHSFFTLCGKFKYKKERRNCQEHADLKKFKRCSDREQRDPLYGPTLKSSYQCFDTKTQGGRRIIQNWLLSDKTSQSCLKRRIIGLHQGIISGDHFRNWMQELADQGLDARINYALDIPNQTGTLQLLFEDTQGGGLNAPSPIVFSAPRASSCSPIQPIQFFQTLKTIVGLRKSLSASPTEWGISHQEQKHIHTEGRFPLGPNPRFPASATP